MELDEKILIKINEVLNKADKLVKICEFDKAINEYKKALEFLGDNVEEYHISILIYASMGDARFYEGEYEKALNYYLSGMNCSNGIANPYLLFGAGQCYYELENNRRAQEYFIKTYMMDGDNLFKVEDPKYYEVIRTMVSKENSDV